MKNNFSFLLPVVVLVYLWCLYSCAIENHEKHVDKNIETLVGQKTSDGTMVMTHKEIHAVNGIFLYMTTYSYETTIQEIGDLIELQGTTFHLNPSFNEDSLLISLVLVADKQFSKEEFVSFVTNMEDIWTISYPGSRLESNKQTRENIIDFFEYKYMVSHVLKTNPKQQQLNISLGYLSNEDEIQNTPWYSVSFSVNSTKSITPVILFCEKNAVQKTARERKIEKLMKDAVKFMEP